MSWYLQGPQNPGTTGPRAPRPPKAHRPPKPRPPHRPTYHDPFAPQSDAQLQASASAQTQAGLAPIIKAITDAINQRSTSGQAAIQGYTKDLAGLFSGAGAQTKAAYDQAQGQQNQVNTALANRLGSFGQNLAGEQGASLASINAPQATGAMTAQTGQTATGASNAGFAQGSAEVGKLIAQSAAGQAYGAKLPGIAGLTGLQNSRQLQAQLNHELASQLGQAQAQAARDLTSTYQHLKDLELQKAIAKQSGLYNQDKLAVDTAYKSAQAQYKQAYLKYQKASKAADRAAKKASQTETGRHNRETESAARARIAATKAKAQAAAKAKKAKNAKNKGGATGAGAGWIGGDVGGGGDTGKTGSSSSSGVPKGLGGGQ